jgi:hypothetical protein
VNAVMPSEPVHALVRGIHHVGARG